MLTKGEAANNYDLIISIALKPKYYFHTVDGQNFENSKVTANRFVEMVNSLDYLDEHAERYSKIYINPFLRICLLASMEALGHSDPVKFRRLPYNIVETIYDLTHASVSHGYRIGVDEVRRHVSQMFKTDQNLTD